MLAYQDSTIALAFMLTYGGVSDLGFESLLTIENAQIIQQKQALIPEPYVLLLFAAGLIGLRLFPNKKTIPESLEKPDSLTVTQR